MSTEALSPGANIKNVLNKLFMNVPKKLDGISLTSFFYPRLSFWGEAGAYLSEEHFMSSSIG